VASRDLPHVCAVGIEGADDLVALAALGVRLGQGHGLARPAAGRPGVAPDAVAALGGVPAPAVP
jgi:EAL domain-containing protein (putative c-di-GMP-specific phosphodiesterase class I)